MVTFIRIENKLCEKTVDKIKVSITSWNDSALTEVPLISWLATDLSKGNVKWNIIAVHWWALLAQVAGHAINGYHRSIDQSARIVQGVGW